MRNRSLSRSLTDGSGVALSLALDAVWKSQSAATDHVAQFLTYLHRVVPPLASGLAP